MTGTAVFEVLDVGYRRREEPAIQETVRGWPSTPGSSACTARTDRLLLVRCRGGTCGLASVELEAAACCQSIRG